MATTSCTIGGYAGERSDRRAAPQERFRLSGVTMETAQMVNKWILGARPRTLGAAVVPVVVGTAVTLTDRRWLGAVDWANFVLALCVAIAVQVGTNFANDYSDGVRGTDSSRVGPVRLVASGLATPSQVRTAALGSFLVAGLAGLVLAVRVSLWLIPLGAVCLLAGWGYTGGPRPYGYVGLGEFFVFVFFGLVATAGSAFVQTETVTLDAVVAGVPVGALAAALLVANNLRDIESDAWASKRTLAVRLGERNTRLLYAVLVVFGVVFAGLVGTASGRWGTLSVFIALPWAIEAVRFVAPRDSRRRSAADWIPLLGATARLHLAVGLLLALGLAATPHR
ncbi:MAG: hypothetical protein KatS3mg008_0094 [Acidimicrobiales bacterium]|nr:MAG: hypothetical protein KatS3mg008_0094 [Acidimicrobiales bacterium]